MQVRTEEARRNARAQLLIHPVLQEQSNVSRVGCVKTLEDEFWKKDGLMEEMMDSFILSVGRIDSSEEGSDSEDCSSDSKLACPRLMHDKLVQSRMA